MKERKVKGQNGVVYWERRCVKRNEGAWLATRKKNIFLGPGAHSYMRVLTIATIYKPLETNISLVKIHQRHDVVK